MKAILSNTTATVILLTLAIFGCVMLGTIAVTAKDESSVKTVALERDWQFEGVWHRAGSKVKCGGWIFYPTRDCPPDWIQDASLPIPTATPLRTATRTATLVTPTLTPTQTITPMPTSTLLARAATLRAGLTETAILVKAGVPAPTATPGPKQLASIDEFYAFTEDAKTWGLRIGLGAFGLVLLIAAGWNWQKTLKLGTLVIELFINLLSLLVVPLGVLVQLLGLLPSLSVRWAGTISGLVLAALGIVVYALWLMFSH